MGLGLSMNQVINRSKVKSDLILEIWDQDLFGSGISIESQTEFKVTKNLGLHIYAGYKTQGYVMGKQLEAGPNVGFGFSYYRTNRD